jgi:WD40 repeat protein
MITSIEEKPEIQIVDAASLETVGELVGHQAWIQDLAIGPGDLVASASGDGTARIWDLSTREELLTVRGHTGSVQSVAFSPDGRLLATAGDDGTARLWDVQTGSELLVLYGHELLAHTVTFSPDGRWLATASADGTVALRLLPVDELRQLADARVSRGLTERECERYLHVETCPGP